MNNDGLLQTAIAILTEATSLDKAGKPNDALLKYTAGVEKLSEFRRKLPADDARRAPFLEKIMVYLNRAEELKSSVRFEVDILEQRRIAADSTGHSYESVFSKCLDDRLTAVRVQDAYIVAHHQVLNFVRFCEMLLRSAKNIKLITLITGNDGKQNEGAFSELTASLVAQDVKLTVSFQPNLHDREIKFNNGWMVKIGRGLDYFKNPGKYAIGACDMNFRKCHETTIDIFKVKM